MRRPAAWREHAAPLAWLFAVALVPLGTAPWTGHVPWFSDIANVDFPIRAYARACVARGEIPWWNPHAACGLPFVADPNTAMFYPPTWALLALAPPIAMLLDIVLHLFAAGALTYAVARIRGTSRAAATLAGTAFALSGVVFQQIQLPGNLRALALTPALAVGAALIARGRLRGGFVVVAVGWALALVAGHPQLAACALPVAAVVAWGDAPCGERRRALLTTVGAVVVGTLVAGAALVPAAEFVRISQRSLGVSAELIEQGSIDALDLVRTVFSRSEFADHVSLGAVVVALAAVAAVSRPRASGALVVAAAFGLLASLGDATPFGRALHAIPPYSSFQVPARHMGTAALAFALLAGDGLDAWRDAARTPARTRLGVAVGLVVVVAAAYASSPGPTTSNDLLKLAPILAALAALVVGPTTNAGRASAVLIALTAADLAVEDGRTYWRADHVVPIASAQWSPSLLDDVPDDARDGSYRILTANRPWHWHNRPTAFGIDNARGHVAFTPLALLDLSHVVNECAPLPRKPIDDPLYAYAPLPVESRLLDLYAIRYAVGFHRPPGPTWRKRAPEVYERDCRMREAHVVQEAKSVPSAEPVETAPHLVALGFDPGRTFWTTTEAGDEPDETSPATTERDARVAEIRHDAGGVRVRLDPGRRGWLFAGWNRLPGFSATVDGRPARIVDADIAFMAVAFPAGAREVDFRYRPAGLTLGVLLSAVGVAALAAAARMLGRAPRTS